MASRHEIVTIDFRANAAKANPAMKSLQQAAHDLREELDKTRAAANEAAKNGAAEAELQKFENEIISQMKTLKQYDAAINTLSKGVGTLARAIDAFNAGTLDKMNAAFQKQSFNAAENAKKLLVPGTEGYEKNMAELDALQQKNLENLAKYKLRTEQMLQSIGEGGKISATDLKTEAEGLEELMKLLPHLGNEWQEYYQILLRVRDAIKQQADEEKRLKGAIADANDARARSAQLTKKGAEEASQQHEAAKKEVESHTAIINKLKEEQAEKKKNMADSAAVLQQKDKEIESQRKTVAAYETAIKNEKKDTKAREDRIIALKQENDALQTTADTNRKTAEQMKGDMKGLEDQLKDVNAELDRMGASRDEKPAAAVTPGAAPNGPAAGKNEERQAVEEKAEADKKEEQAVRNKTKAKKEETQAVKENTAAKKEEAQAAVQAEEAEKKEDLTKEQILKRQDELKVQLQDLYNEKREYARQQEQNTAAAKKEAEAVKEEANAYKDLTKEQAEALLQQRRSTITKGEDGKFSFTNAEEAQHFIMESMRQMGGKNGNEYSLSDKGQVKQLLGQFKERYGLQSDDDTVGAIRGLFASGGLVESGVMNPFLPRMNVKASADAAAYAKDMKDLTAIINGNTEAVKENIKVTEESNKAKRTEADIDADIKAKESEQRQLTMQLRRMNGELDTTEQLIKKKGSLAETSRKSAEAFKEELAVLRSLNKEQAALMLKGMTEPSTVKFRGGAPFASDIEEVQSWFIKNVKGMVGNGHAFDEGGTLRLDERGIASMVERFKDRYKFDGSKKDLNDLFKSVVQSRGGLFESGFVSDFGKGGKLSVNYDAMAFEQRIKVMDTLTEVSGGAAKATDKVTKSTKDNTAAAKENTDTISEQERKVADLKQKWDDAKEEYRKYNDEYKRQMREVKRLEKGSMDEQLLAREKESAAETYKETYVDKAATRRDQYKQLYTSSNKKLESMRKAEGQDIREATAAENQNTEATDRNAQAKGRKAKATKAAADAQKEQNKADGEGVAQGQQLSAEEQKKQDLLRKREALQGQLNEKQEKANRLEEEAAGADTKRENNLKTITDLQNENVNAHTKNEQALRNEKEKLEKLESQQDKNIHKYNEDKDAVEGLTKKIDEHATKRAEANKRAAQTERLTIDAMNDAVKALEAENRAIDPQSAKWQENTRVIQQYKAEIDRLKNQPVLQMMTERMGNIRNLSADALTETKRFWEQMAAGAEHGSHKLAVYEGNLKVIAEEERQRQQQIQAPMRENLNNLGRLSTADLTETKRYWQTVRDGADQTSAAYKKAELAVKALANEEQRRKDHAQAQYISDQMKDLNNLSVSGLAEVKRYWQAMADGAKRGSDEAKDAANALARINEVELRNTKQQVRPLFGDLSKKGTEEIRAAIEAGRRLIDTYDSGSPAAQRLAQAIVDAEEHLKKYGVEAERAARREAAAVEEAAQRRREQDSLMRQQLDQGTALSESALRSQQQYWQRLIDDPKTAKESLAGYRYELERTIELQEQQARATNNDLAARISSPSNLGNYSTAELRESIEAAKQLAASYQSGSKEAQDLTKNIVTAEEHINKYSLESERAARKEAQAIADMEKQLSQGTDLTESALKAQENYWRRLADDPKAAANEVAYYFEQLNKVRELQQQQADAKVKVGGLSVLDRMRSDVDYESKISENQRKEDIAALKAYRDALPKEGNASVLKEIDYYLAQLGASAREGAQAVMSLADAEALAGRLGTKGFSASTIQLQQAKKALEEAQAAAGRGTKRFTELQNAINKVDLALRQTGEITEEVQAVLDKPKGRSLNALKQAVEQGRVALQNMDRTTKDGQKAFDELAKKIKATELELKQMAGEAKATVSAFDKAWSRLKTYVGLYVGASVAMNKLVGTMGDLMDLSDKMGEVRKTTGFTADEVGRLTGELKKLDVRTSLVELMEVSAAAGQLGLKTEEDVLGFTEAANKLMIALPEMGKEAATEMMRVAIATGEVDKIRKQLQEGTVEGSSATAVAMEKIASTIDRLRATSAATAPEITDFVKRVGAVGAQSGISIDQVSALGSTISSLGMRVEMSATALSRMIPAIRRNAFDVAKAIGMAPEALRKMFDEAGGGMNAMLAIFRHIKDSGMDEDSIEKMLGMGDMAEIMKELNQQGARAGIVFAGLSQNVDELEKQLAIASDAYERNVAVQNEFNKMNETTAAKWARLKNQLEELFVSDKMQRMLGNIIDGLRKIVDLIAGDSGISGAVRYIILYLSIFKAKWAEAIGAGIISTGKFIWSMRASAVAAEADAAAKTADAAATASLGTATETTTKKTNLFTSAWRRMDDAMKANFITAAAMALVYLGTVLWDAHKAAQKAAESIRRVKENTDEEKAAVKQLFRPLKDANLQHEDKVKLIKSINSQYGTYLSKMLTEASNAQDIARAYEAINLQLERKNILEGMESNKKDVQERRKGLLDSAYNEMDSAVGKAAKTGVDASRISSYISKKVSEAVEQGLSPEQMRRSIQEELGKEIKSGDMKKYVQIISGGQSRRESADSYIAYAAKRYYDAQMKVQGEVNTANKRLQSDLDNVVGKVRDAASKDIPTLVSDFDKALGKGTDAKKYNAKESAAVVEAFDAIKAYYDLHRDDLTAEQKKLLDAKLGVDVSTFKNKVKSSGGGGGGGGNIWGSNAPADSTDYGTWDVNELVARRNQMDKFKNVLKPDTDIRAVLAEDKALMKALDNGLKEDWKSVLGWYNTERKKIQEELKSERFSTNEGHWRDEKQGRGRRNRFRESDYALAELDRYYSKRKEDLEKARIEENMSEELFNRQAELLEQEHLERRSKLRETFTAGSTEQEKKMVKQFREWWSQLEKQGLLDEVPWATVESEWSKALASEIGRNNLRAQQDLTKLQEITVKHLNEIAKLIDKERPYDGITANLRKNLTEMDILLADLQKDGPEKDTAKLVKAETARLKFLLSEAEQAYSLNFEQLKEKMVKEGFGEWAQAIEGDEQLKQSLMQNLRNTYDAIQDAIKKESSVIKKQLEIQWNDLMPGSDMSMKGMFEKAVSDLGLAGDQVKRANSLIGAGTASDRVADKLAIQQMRIQLQMQETYFALMQKIGHERIKQLEQSAVANEREAKALKEKAELLRKEGKTAEAEVTELKAQNALRQSLQDKFDAEHAAKSLSLARTKELAEEEKQRVAIANQLEETQNRLYTELRSWADLLASSLQGVMEAGHTADREYYNERAKLNLTGKGGPGAGTYIVIDNEGTSDAKAHYEYLDERQALERQREIENDNAVKDAWKKMMDDLNQKMSDTITDQLNAMLQNQSIDANTTAINLDVEATKLNTAATDRLTQQLAQGTTINKDGETGGNATGTDDVSELAYGKQNPAAGTEAAPAPVPDQVNADALNTNTQAVMAQTQMIGEMMGSDFAAENQGGSPSADMDPMAAVQGRIDANNLLTDTIIKNKQKEGQVATEVAKKEEKGTGNMYAKMTQAANLYGAAYQAMSNDNLSTSQKFQMIALQAAGNAAIGMLTADFSEKSAETVGTLPAILAKCLSINPIAGAAIFAVLSALLGGMMGMAVSKIAKGKQEIAQATGASASAGRLSTGMMTYAEGNVNEFTDPRSLTPGRHYNVDGADGRTYRAKYTGSNPGTHLTGGPEFHLVGERGREMIIDAGTTRQITMNEAGIWHAIQTLSGGGRLRHAQRRGRGVRAFADGNLDEFDEIGGEMGMEGGTAGMAAEQMDAFRQSLDRNSAIMERLAEEGIEAYVSPYGKRGIVNGYDTYKKEAQRHGERY